MRSTQSSASEHSDPSGGGDSQPACRHQIVGKRVHQRHGLDLDQSTNLHESKAVVLAVGVDPLDQFAKSVNLLAGVAGHPAAPLFDTFRLARPLALPILER